MIEKTEMISKLNTENKIQNFEQDSTYIDYLNSYKNKKFNRTNICDIPLVQIQEYTIKYVKNPDSIKYSNLLIHKMYGWRGYSGVHQVNNSRKKITLSAFKGEKVVGTITLNVDEKDGLLAEQVYKPSIDNVKVLQTKINHFIHSINTTNKVPLKEINPCEFTKFAFDEQEGSKALIGALFHTVFIYAMNVFHCTDAFIEVNPRHKKFYEALLGFQVIGDLQINPSVNAPGYLLWLNFEENKHKISDHGGKYAYSCIEGQQKPANMGRSLFPYFFAPQEIEKISERIAFSI